MKCTQLQQMLDDYIEGQLDSAAAATLENHVMGCKSCESSVHFARSVLAGIKQTRHCYPHEQNEINEFFITKSSSNVRKQYPDVDHNVSLGVKTGFITALAAGFSLWAVMSVYVLPTMKLNRISENSSINSTVNKMSTLDIALNETRIVRIAIDSPDQFDKVTLSMILPKHIELTGHHKKQVITWQAKLNKGNNVLKIPLKAIEQGQGPFITKIAHHGKTKTFKLFLNTQEPDSSRIQSFELHV